jgi:hypothetical protein
MTDDVLVDLRIIYRRDAAEKGRLVYSLVGR